jgi:hypothetical protein
MVRGIGKDKPLVSLTTKDLKARILAVAAMGHHSYMPGKRVFPATWETNIPS